MIHICKSDTGFLVATIGKNGEPLSVSEVLTSKANCWKNIRAQTDNFNSDKYDGIIVQDDTLKKSVTYVYSKHYWDDKWVKTNTGQKPNPPYVPKSTKPKYSPKKK